jgi:hypothetical protein
MNAIIRTRLCWSWLVQNGWAISIASLLVLVPTVVHAQHDCVLYDPTVAGAVIDSNWGTPTEIDNYQIVVPPDLGGGYVVARIAATAQVEPEMSITHPSTVGQITQSGTNTNGPSPFVLEVVFEVYGGETYDVELREDVQAPLAAHPVVYQWSWSFVSRVDCYEHNDGSPGTWPDPTVTARQIPLNQELAAYSLAGHLSYSIPQDAPHTWDWYEINIGVPTTLWFGTTQVPSDQRIRLRLFDAGGFVEVNGATPNFGETIVVGPALVDPGTYYLEIHPENHGPTNATLSEGGTIPDHFNTPYHFVVATEAIPSCGFAAIFCDGFESGDTTFWSVAQP